MANDEEAGFDNHGDDDEDEGQDHGGGEGPAEEILPNVEASESGHEKAEDEGHGVGDGLCEFFDSFLLVFLLKVEIIGIFGVEELQLSDLAFIFKLLDNSPLLGGLLFPLEHEFHIVVGDDVLPADFLVDVHVVAGGYSFWIDGVVLN